MKSPEAYTPEQILAWDVRVQTEISPGKWVSARPYPWPRSIFSLHRFKLAWKVLTGKYDALRWQGQE